MFDYMCDGADPQARATLSYLTQYGGVESSYCATRYEYEAKPRIARWENCREQGYVISLRNETNDQINIAFFEHRNSDTIHAVMWFQNTINSPTIDTAKFGNIYKDKFDTSYCVGYGEAEKMASWIYEQLEKHWES